MVNGSLREKRGGNCKEEPAAEKDKVAWRFLLAFLYVHSLSWRALQWHRPFYMCIVLRKRNRVACWKRKKMDSSVLRACRTSASHAETRAVAGGSSLRTLARDANRRETRLEIFHALRSLSIRRTRTPPPFNFTLRSKRYLQCGTRCECVGERLQRSAKEFEACLSTIARRRSTCASSRYNLARSRLSVHGRPPWMGTTLLHPPSRRPLPSRGIAADVVLTDTPFFRGSRVEA